MLSCKPINSVETFITTKAEEHHGESLYRDAVKYTQLCILS